MTKINISLGHIDDRTSNICGYKNINFYRDYELKKIKINDLIYNMLDLSLSDFLDKDITVYFPSKDEMVDFNNIKKHNYFYSFFEGYTNYCVKLNGDMKKINYVYSFEGYKWGPCHTYKNYPQDRETEFDNDDFEENGDIIIDADVK